MKAIGSLGEVKGEKPFKMFCSEPPFTICTHPQLKHNRHSDLKSSLSATFFLQFFLAITLWWILSFFGAAIFLLLRSTAAAPQVSQHDIISLFYLMLKWFTVSHFYFSPVPEVLTSDVDSIPSRILTAASDTIACSKSAWLSLFPAASLPFLVIPLMNASPIVAWVASLINKTFLEAKLAKPVEHAPAVLASCL